MNTLTRLILFIALLQINFAVGNAQVSDNGFVFLDDRADYQRPMSMVEFEDAYIVLCQYYFTEEGCQDYDYLIKLDKNGTKISEAKIKTAENKVVQGCRSLVKLNDTEFAVLGTTIADTLNSGIYDFFYAVYTTDLNQSFAQQITKPYGALHFANAFLNDAGNIILYGALSPINPPPDNWYYHATIVEFATNGSLLNTYYNSIVSPIGRIWHLQEYNDNYLAVQTCILENEEGQYRNVTFCRYSKDNLQVKYPYFEVDEPLVPLAYAGHIIPANDSAFLLVGRALVGAKQNKNQTQDVNMLAVAKDIYVNKDKTTNFLLGLAHLDTACQLQGNVEHYAHFSDGDSYPGFWQSADIDKTNPNAFYCSGVSPMSLKQFPNYPNTVWTYKFNTVGEEQWVVQYREPNDSAYFINYSTYATTDGGVMLLNQRYNFNPNEDMDVHIMKYDSEGLLSVQDSEAEYMQIQPYPNPTKDILHLDMPSLFICDNTYIRITDMCGRLLIDQAVVSTHNSIDVSTLCVGIYTYTVVQGQQVKARGKWVKQ